MGQLAKPYHFFLKTASYFRTYPHFSETISNICGTLLQQGFHANVSLSSNVKTARVTI